MLLTDLWSATTIKIIPFKKSVSDIHFVLRIRFDKISEAGRDVWKRGALLSTVFPIFVFRKILGQCILEINKNLYKT